jgi:hypothetical protein
LLIRPPERKILRNTEMSGWSDVRNRLLASVFSGAAKNLRDPCFGEKMENFGCLWCLGE